MAFSKSIHIDVASLLTGPPGWDDVKIVMAFDHNAIQSNTKFIPVSWMYVYPDCTIDWITVLIRDFAQGRYSPP